MTITPAQENERMLARILGMSEEDAAARLAVTIGVTTGDGPAQAFAGELTEQLERTVSISAPNAPCDLEIIIHATAARKAAKRIYVTIGADEVAISRTPPETSSPPAPLHGLQTIISASYAASVALSEAIGGLDLVPDTDPFVVRFATFGVTADVLSTPIILDDTVLAGAGAVANGFLRAARHLDISGGLTVADPKVVGSGNPNRCLFFTSDDVGKPKAERLCEVAQPGFPRLALIPFFGTFSALRKQRGRIRRVITTTDSRRTRRTIQKELPLEVIDASTTGVREVIVHSHRQPNADACLACIYKHIPDELARERDIAAGLGVALEVVASGALIDNHTAEIITAEYPQLDKQTLVGKAFDSLFKQLCGEQVLHTPTGEQALAPFAFVSSLAGALLALELARFELGVRFEEATNYLFASPWAPPHPRLRRRRSRAPDCEFCGQAITRQIWASVWPDWLKQAAN